MRAKSHFTNGSFYPAFRQVVVPLLRRNRWTTLWLASEGIIHIFALLWIPLVVQRLFEQASRFQTWRGLLWTGSELVLAAIVASVFSALLEIGATRSLYRDFEYVETTLFEKMMAFPVPEFEKRGVGYLYSRMRDDVPLLAPLLIGDAAPFLLIALQLLAVIVLLFRMDWAVASTGLVIAAVLALANSALTPRLRKMSGSAQEEVARLSGYLAEILSHTAVIKSCNAEGRESRRFATENHALNQRKARLQGVARLLGEANSGLGRLGFLAIALVGAWRIHQGAVTAPLFMSSIVYINILFYSSRSLINFTPRMAAAMEATVRISEMLSQASEAGRFGSLRPSQISGAVSLKDISFSYDGVKPVLDHMSLEIPEGSKVAIVGPSGSGKTTILKLILGFESPGSGVIRLGGYPLHELDLKFIRENVGYVPQGDTCVLRRTIRENISLASPDASEEQISRAAISAQALSFITSLPKTFDTIVGTDQDAFSGGQAQRIGLAREFLREPRVLVMDEATSQLDARTERDVLVTLQNAFPRTTCLVVSHRLASVTDFDFIVVVENGKVAAAGTHAQLMEQSGLYSQLFSVQTQPVGGGPESEAVAFTY
jgi:ABC-type multidrug transport system fused ATPase/permease subunit